MYKQQLSVGLLCGCWYSG